LLFIALMPLGSALLRSISLISHSLGQIQQSAFSLMGLRPLLYLFSLGIIASLGMMSVEMGLAASVFALAGAASYQLFFLKTILPARPKTPLPPNAEWQRTGLVLMLTVLFIDEFPNLVSLLASAALGEDDVAILAIALRVALLLRMITAATTMVISPKLSAHIGEGEWRPATQLTHQMVRLSALSIGGGSLILYLFAPFILSFFGGAYEEGVIILRLLIFIPLISAFFGPSLMILTAAGQTKIIFKTTAFALILLSFGTIISSPFGVMGVTLTLISIHFLWETSLFVAVWRQGFRPWLPHAILSLRKP
ncbi:MAG: MATE family efflux transporter, partial [Pseudomonadota bacterium]